jgi:hypothetical protein
MKGFSHALCRTLDRWCSSNRDHLDETLRHCLIQLPKMTCLAAPLAPALAVPKRVATTTDASGGERPGPSKSCSDGT